MAGTAQAPGMGKAIEPKRAAPPRPAKKAVQRDFRAVRPHTIGPRSQLTGGHRWKTAGHFKVRETWVSRRLFQIIEWNQYALAEGVGFEPTRGLHPWRFSRPLP